MRAIKTLLHQRVISINDSPPLKAARGSCCVWAATVYCCCWGSCCSLRCVCLLVLLCCLFLLLCFSLRYFSSASVARFSQINVTITLFTCILLCFQIWLKLLLVLEGSSPRLVIHSISIFCRCAKVLVILYSNYLLLCCIQLCQCSYSDEIN